MKRMLVAHVLAYFVAGGSLAWSAADERVPPRPNILFIYADDWGWGDLAGHGHPEIQTPHLDRLAREGTDFHQFTVCNPVCSPSRVAILTGHYPARYLVHQHFAGHQQNVERGMPDWLDPTVPLLPRLLKHAGYRTAHYGKWHLSGGGVTDAPHPHAYGYDDSAVYVGPGRHVFAGTSMGQLVREPAAHDRVAASFLSVAATEHALRFISGCGDDPFYVNVWLHETHHLVSATDEDKRAYPNTPEPQRTYYAAVTRADRQIGRLLTLLDELGKADNTIVIFSSDNGPEQTHPRPGDKFYYSVGSTGGLRGRKRSLYLGGVNTPFIVRWPGHVPAGRVDNTAVLSGVDMLPTLLAAANVPVPADYQPDGVNVLAAWRGEPFERRRPIFWEWRGTHASDANWPELAVRDGDWGLLMTEDGQRVELYDLSKDRRQQQDVAKQHPEQVAELIQSIRQWKATLPAAPPQQTIPSRSPAEARRLAANRARAFVRWDTNKDGVLTLAEYTTGLTKADDAEARFRKFDRDGDGKLTRQEFVGREKE